MENKNKLISVILIILFLLLGELVKMVFNLPIPGSIIGMVLIFMVLKLKWIRLEQVKPTSDFLLKYLSLFYVPYGVGLVTQYKFLNGKLTEIIIALVLSTFLAMFITMKLFKVFEKNE